MRDSYKRMIALLFDTVSGIAFAKSLDYVVQINTPTIPSKETAIIGDYALLALQGGELALDGTSKDFNLNAKLSKAWYYIKSAGIPMALGAAAVTIFYNYQLGHGIDPSLGSNVCLLIGLGSQYAKNKIVYRD